MTRPILLTLAVLVLCGCGGPEAPSADQLRAARAFTGSTDELEDRAAALTEALTEAVTAPASTDDEVVERVRNWLTEHAEELDRIAAAVRAPAESLEPHARRFYEESLAERMAGPTWAWADAVRNFRATHPETAVALDEVLGDVWVPPVDEEE